MVNLILSFISVDCCLIIKVMTKLTPPGHLNDDLTSSERLTCGNLSCTSSLSRLSRLMCITSKEDVLEKENVSNKEYKKYQKDYRKSALLTKSNSS